MKFSQFTLDHRLQKALASMEYEDCTAVQEAVLQQGLNGADLFVQSQTGTGKTAAYLVTMLQEMLTAEKAQKALILVPTRELAVQVAEECKHIAQFTSFSIATFYGGVGYHTQLDVLKKGTDILIGTPGRIIDLQKSKKMDLSSIQYLIIDEADRMFDMGFYPDLRKLLKNIPPASQRQTFLLSATLSTYVKNLAWEYSDNAQEICIDAENITVDDIEQKIFHVESDKKLSLLLGLLKKEQPQSLIIFCNTKKGAEILAKRLILNNITTAFLSGDLPQKKRLAILTAIKEGSLSCLVATDVAARGIDISNLSMVINFDLPQESENYVHRIGRTARAGNLGKAYSLCSEQDVYNLPNIERYIEKPIPATLPEDSDFAPDASKDVYIKLNAKQDFFASKDKGRRKRDGTPRTGAKKASMSHKKENMRKKNTKQSTEKLSPPSSKTPPMSFEKRMEVYRKKYASQTVLEREKGSKKHRQAPPQCKHQKTTVKEESKKGFFARISAWFSRKA